MFDRAEQRVRGVESRSIIVDERSLAAMPGIWRFEEGGTTKPKRETVPRWIIRMDLRPMDVGEGNHQIGLGLSVNLHHCSGSVKRLQIEIKR